MNEKIVALKGSDDKRRKELIGIYMKPLFGLGERDVALLNNPGYTPPERKDATPKPEELPDYIYELHLYGGFALEAIAQLWEDSEQSDTQFFMALSGLQEKDTKRLTEKYKKAHPEAKPAGPEGEGDGQEEAKGDNKAAVKLQVSGGDEPVEPMSPKREGAAGAVAPTDPWRDFEKNAELAEYISTSAEKVESKNYKVDDELTEADEGGAAKKAGKQVDYFANVVIEDEKAALQNLKQAREKVWLSLLILGARKLLSALLTHNPQALTDYTTAGGKPALNQTRALLKLLGNEAVFEKAIQGGKRLEDLVKKVVGALLSAEQSLIESFLIEDTWALVKQLVAGEELGGATEAAALKTNKPEFILLMLENVLDTQPHFFLERPHKLKELLNLILVLEVNLEEKQAFEMHSLFSRVLQLVAAAPSPALLKAVLQLEVLETYSLTFKFDSSSDCVQKPMERIMFEILGAMHSLEQTARTQAPDVSSLYYYSEDFLKLTALRDTLENGFDFKPLLFKKLLGKVGEAPLPPLTLQTAHPLPRVFTTAKVGLEGVQQLELNFDEDCKLPDGALVAVTRDLEGKQFERCCSGKALAGKSVKVAAAACYLHFPLFLNGVEFVGSHNSSYYEGMDAAVEGVALDTICTKKIKSVLQAPRSTHLLTEDGELWSCGSGKQSLTRQTKLKIGARKVRLFSANNSQMLFVTEGETPALKGIDDYSNNYRLGKTTSGNNPEELSVPDDVDVADIVGLKTWNDGSYYWLKDGRVFGIGYNNYGQLGVDNSVYTQETWRKLELPMPVKQLAIDNQWTLALCEEGTKTALFSAGQRDQSSYTAVLGHQRPDGDKFTRLDTPAGVEWKAVAADYYNGYALSEDGTLYAWGMCDRYKLMDQTADNWQKPTKVNSLAPFEVLEIKTTQQYGVLRVRRRKGHLAQKKEEEIKKKEEEEKEKEKAEKEEEEQKAKKEQAEGEGEGEKKEEKKEGESEKKKEEGESEKKEEQPEGEKKEEEPEGEKKELTEEEKEAAKKKAEEEAEEKKKKEAEEAEEKKKKEEEEHKKKEEDKKREEKELQEEAEGTQFFLFFGNRDNQENLLTSDEKTAKENKPFVRMSRWDGKHVTDYSISDSHASVFAVLSQHESVQQARKDAARAALALPDGSSVERPLSFVKVEGDQQLKFFKEEEEAPKLSYISKLPVDTPADKAWPDLREFEKECTGDKLAQPEYWCVTVSGGENVLTSLSGSKKLTKLKSDDFWAHSAYDLQPAVYIKATHSVSAGLFEKLPRLQLHDYFPGSECFGLKVGVKACLEFSAYNEEVVKNNQKEWDKLEKQYLKLSPAEHQEMLKVFESYFMANAGTKLSGLSELKIEKKWLSRKSIDKHSEEQLTRYSELVIDFSKNVLSLLRYTNFRAKGGQSILDLYMKIKEALPYAMKGEFIHNLRDNLTAEGSSQDMAVDRIGAKEKAGKGKVDHTGDWSIFGQIMRKMKDKKLKPLKVNSSKNQCWKTHFVHEGGDDWGGLFRECLFEFSNELMSSALPLFCKTPNNKNDCGEHREKWTVNPSAASPSHLEMFEFLGSMIGMSVRADHLLNFEMAGIFWKNLLEQKPELGDLSSIDSLAVKSFENLQKMKDTGAGDEIEYLDYTFTTILSNGEEVELKRGGKDIVVTGENLEEYIELAKEKRLSEGTEQYEAIRRGINFIVPSYFLKLLSWRELEFKVCGRKEIEAEALKAITTYSGGDASCATAKFFWKMFEELTYDERALYLRFVWGRSRLPLPGEETENKHQISFIDSEGDKKLPIAHTCFFEIEVPRYSTQEIMKDKMLYAIKFCQAIDTDGSPYEVMEGDRDSDSEEEE